MREIRKKLGTYIVVRHVICNFFSRVLLNILDFFRNLTIFEWHSLDQAMKRR